MGMACWHDNRFSFVQQIFNAINRDFSDTIQAGDEGCAGYRSARYVDKGYVFYMSPSMLRDLGYSEEVIKEMLDARRLEVVGDGSADHPGMADAKVGVRLEQFNSMIRNIRECVYE